MRLKIAAENVADRLLIEQLAKSWSNRTGAEIDFVDRTFDSGADVGLIVAAELPRLAESGQLAELPSEWKRPASPYRWDDVLSVYNVRLTNWRDRTMALPVVGDGMVFIYRKDACNGLNGRPSGPPQTWDEFVDAAQSLGKNSVPPLPADADALAAQFFTAAACYDRLAIGRISAGELIREEFFTFQFDVSTGAPRLNSPAFQHVAELLRKLQPYRSTAPDVVSAFNRGDAKLGIVTLRELGQLNTDVLGQIGIAPLPGAKFIFDSQGVTKQTDQQTVNRVPYWGWGSRLGVVSVKCSNQAAAWDFLADAGLPDRTALDLLAAPRLGAGPYRSSQLEGRARARWFAYGLPSAETDRLIFSLRENLGLGIQNYRVRLRTPNQRELALALDEELRKVIIGTRPADLTAANQRWQQIIDRLPPSEWKSLARKSLGI